MAHEQPFTFNDRRTLIHRSLTYVFSLRVEYCLEIAGLVELPEHFNLPMVAQRASTFHVQGDDVVTSASNQALEWPRVIDVSGASDLLLSGASSEDFRGKLRFEVEGGRRIAVDHFGRLKVGGGTRRVNQLRNRQLPPVEVTGSVRAAFRFSVDNPRFRWLEFNQLVGVGDFAVTRPDDEDGKPTSMSEDPNALLVVADFDLYVAF